MCCSAVQIFQCFLIYSQSVDVLSVSASPPYIPPPYSFDNQHKDKAASTGNEIPW